jgi:hypothetical protein
MRKGNHKTIYFRDSQVNELKKISDLANQLNKSIEEYKNDRFVRPYCPDCAQYMVKKYIKREDGLYILVWTCECIDRVPQGMLRLSEEAIAEGYQ